MPETATVRAVLTLAEVAALLRVSQRTVARMAASGALRSIALGKRCVRFSAADVHAIIEGAPAKAEHRSHLAAWHVNREARE